MAGPSLPMSKHNIGFLFICVCGLVLLVLVSIVPLINQQKKLANQIPEINAKLTDQKQIAQVLVVIDKKLKELEGIESLADISKESLDLGESSSVIYELREMAVQEELTVVEVRPVMPKTSGELTELNFEAGLQGQLDHMRSFLFSLLEKPYVKQIEKLEVESDDHGLNFELVFSVRLS